MKEKIKDYLVILLKLVLYVGFIVIIYGVSVYLIKNLSDLIAKNILEYLKVLIWPLIILFAMLVFQKDISGLLNRLIKGKIPMFGEWEASPVTEQEKEVANLSKTEPVGIEFTQIMNQKEAEISALQNTTQQLIEGFTKAQIELDFERIYNFVFANQIELLNRINSLGGEVSFTFVADHFMTVQNSFLGLKEWDGTKYLSFLVNNQLLEYKSAVGSFGSVAITTKGKAFIAYITARSYKKYGL